MEHQVGEHLLLQGGRRVSGAGWFPVATGGGAAGGAARSARRRASAPSARASSRGLPVQAVRRAAGLRWRGGVSRVGLPGAGLAAAGAAAVEPLGGAGQPRVLRRRPLPWLARGRGRRCCGGCGGAGLAGVGDHGGVGGHVGRVRAPAGQRRHVGGGFAGPRAQQPGQRAPQPLVDGGQPGSRWQRLAGEGGVDGLVHGIGEVVRAQPGERARAGVAGDGGPGAGPALAREERPEVGLLGAVDKFGVGHWSALRFAVRAQGAGPAASAPGVIRGVRGGRPPSRPALPCAGGGVEPGDAPGFPLGGGEDVAVRAFVVAGHPGFHGRGGGVDDQALALDRGQGADLLGGERLAVLQRRGQRRAAVAALPADDGLAVLPRQLGDLAQVLSGQAAEDRLDRGRAPQHRGGVGAPPVAGLGHRLEHGGDEDPGAAGERHQRRELGQRDDVGDLVEEQAERRVEPPARQTPSSPLCLNLSSTLSAEASPIKPMKQTINPINSM